MKAKLAAITCDEHIQQRLCIDEATVADYAESMHNGVVFPPVVVFEEDGTLWLADGFHRVEAAGRAGKESIAVTVRQGTERDAILFAIGANAKHGLRRTNADKRQAVRTLLEDDEWAQWSNRAIAKRAGVTHTFVNNRRAEMDAGPGASGNGFHPIDPNTAGEDTHAMWKRMVLLAVDLEFAQTIAEYADVMHRAEALEAEIQKYRTGIDRSWAVYLADMPEMAA